MPVVVHAGPSLDPAEVTPAPSDGGATSVAAEVRGRHRLVGVLVLTALAFTLRVWAPGPVTQTVDEVVWLKRSDRFATAIAHGDFARASASNGEVATMPGVTTMWAGTLGKAVLRLGTATGVLDDAAKAYGPNSAAMLRVSRAFVALWCSLALGLLVLLAASLLGWRAAWIAGALLATEPFLVGHSDVLHTDATVTMFAAVSVLAFAAALDAPAGRARGSATATAWPSRRVLACVSGVFAGLAALTKANALVVVATGMGIVVVGHLVASWRGARERGEPRRVAARMVPAAGWFCLTSVIVVVALWPALWVAPGTELSRLRESLTQAGKGHSTFFRGVVSTDPGPLFYPVTMAFRLTPWLLVGGLIALGAAGATLFRRRSPAGGWPRRDILALLVGTPAVYVLSITLTEKKLDRYALPVVPFLALLVGVTVAWTVEWIGRRLGNDRWLRPAGVAAVAVMAGYTLLQAPYAISYASPLVGGQRRAESTILLGWGEGTERLGAEILAREGTNCANVVVSYPQAFRTALPCVQLRGMGFVNGSLESLDYVILYVTMRQRHAADLFDAAVRLQGRLVRAVEIGGVRYAELYHIDH